MIYDLKDNNCKDTIMIIHRYILQSKKRALTESFKPGEENPAFQVREARSRVKNLTKLAT